MSFEDFYEHHGEKLRGKAVVHYTDAQNVARMLQVGSRNMDLHKRVLRLYLKLKELDINHVAVWIPREDPRIKVADAGSREFDVDNWMIDTPNFLKINEHWGEFTVDVFASEENARVTRFYSVEKNAFCQNLSGEHIWACPPPRLILPAVKLFAKFRVTGVVCVPLWQASPFWIALCPNGTHLANFVKDFVIFQPFFVAGKDMTNKTFQGFSKFKMIALDCDFSVSNPMAAQIKDYFKLV